MKIAQTLSKIKALIIKELVVLLKDPKSRYALIMPPLVQLILFSSVATLDVFNIKLAVLNQDGGSYSREIVRDVVASREYFTDIIEVRNYDEIKELIDKQKVIGAMVFGADFSRDVAANRTAQMQLLFDGRRLNSASIVSGYLQKIIQNSLENKTEFRVQHISSAVKPDVVVRHWFNPNLNYKWFIIPSLMALILSSSILGVASLSIARERELGTFDQLIVSPLTPFQIMLGKVAANLAIGLVQGTVVFFIIASVIPFHGNLIYMFLGILLYLISMTSLGLFISSMSANQQQATLGSFFFLMPIILTSGFSAPFANMPHWMQLLSDWVNPIHHFVTITQMVFNKGVNFELLHYNFLMLSIISIITFFGAVWFFKRRVI